MQWLVGLGGETLACFQESIAPVRDYIVLRALPVVGIGSNQEHD